MKEAYVSCYEGLIDGKDLYIVDIQYSLLIKYNIIDFSYEILTDFIYWSSGLPFRVIKIFKVDKSLYFITSNRYCVFEYNILSHKVSVYEKSDNLGDKWIIKDGFMYKNKIYIFPLRIDESIQIFDIVTKTFYKFKSIEESLNVNDIVIPLKSNVSEGVNINSDIYVAVCGTSYICQISLIHKEIDVWNVGKGVHISGITLDKNKYWLISDEDKMIYEWNPYVGISDYHEIKTSVELNKKESYKTVIVYKNKYFLIPRFNGYIFVFEDNVFRRLEYPLGFKIIHGDGQRALFRGYEVIHDNIYLFPCAYNGLLILNMENCTIKVHNLILKKEEIKECYRKMIEISNISYENKYCTIDMFINNGKIGANQNIYIASRSIGQTIYDSIKSKGECR